MKLTKEQLKAKRFALKGGDRMITGEGGTGKSHILIDIFKDEECDVAAYTHAAKNRLIRDGVHAARTISSLLESSMLFNLDMKSEHEELLINENEVTVGYKKPLLLLDECSMAPADMIKTLKSKYNKIIFFGDVVQLPPPQGVMYDFDGIKKFELTENHRSNKKLLKKIRKNRKSPDISHYKRISLDKIEKKLKAGEDVRILCFKNKDVDYFNDKLGKYTKSLINNVNNVRKLNEFGGYVTVQNGDIIDDYTPLGRKIDHREHFNVYFDTPMAGDEKYSDVEYIEIDGVVFQYVKSVETYKEIETIAKRDFIEMRDKYKLSPRDHPELFEKFKKNPLDFDVKKPARTEVGIRAQFVSYMYKKIKNRLDKDWKYRFTNMISITEMLVLKPTVSLTVHKAQGQTFDNVAVVEDSRGIGHDLSLTYVAVSRAKKNVWVLK